MSERNKIHDEYKIHHEKREKTSWSLDLQFY